jgi:DNA polymerase I-like protein with 3'-5' exonuclease and polymerase domains|tara:strand:+ start:14 stop:1654 length:1641 start_codon:yes stop_codon:yes gene_type:complete
MTTAIVDIETDSLNPTKIHCIVAREYPSGKERVWIKDQCTDFGRWSGLIDQFIMHNGVSFDAPILNRFTGSNIKLSQIKDTLIESQLYNPVREGGHSLGAWGDRLGFPKGEHEDFSRFTPEMLAYCRTDTELTSKVSGTLLGEGYSFSDRSYDLERKVRAIINRQEKNGFAFNIKDAIILLAQLQDEEHRLEQEAKEIFKPAITYSPVRKVRKETEFNIASRKQIAERLIEKGWEPKHKTDKDNVIISEEILSKINMPEAQMFSRYFLLQKRTGLLKAWIQGCQEDNRVRGKVLTLRTITGRMAHNSPNMAQVPAIYSPYGKECRGLWTVSNPNTHVLMGTDASGLEVRCLAHYMKDEKFTYEVLNGDVHTANMKAAGLANRDQAKTFIYAFLYGAGAAKIGKIVGGKASQGQVLIDRFLQHLPALKRLRTNIQEAAQEKTIPALDGRRLHIRSAHTSLNTLLQGAGAIICKEWLVHMDILIRRRGLDAKLVASIHDEYQFEVARKDRDAMGMVAKKAMEETTESLNMKCPLDCEHKSGQTWAETH